jgi:hypothetical protein
MKNNGIPLLFLFGLMIAEGKTAFARSQPIQIALLLNNINTFRGLNPYRKFD